MSNISDINQVWDLAHLLKICMLTSWNGEQQLSRPMASRIDKERGAIYFLDRVDSAKEDEIKKYSAIGLSYADRAGNTYLAIAGHAWVSNDRTIIKEIWSDFDRAYFDSADDQTIRLITVTPQSAEIWEGSNRLFAGTKMLFAALTGAKPDMGETKKVSLA